MAVTTPNSRPVNLSTEEVRALQEGRLSVIRRVVRPQPAFGCRYVMNGDGAKALHCADGERFEPVPVKATSADHRLPCPLGAPGDVLYVRETWAVLGDYAGRPINRDGEPCEFSAAHVIYRADTKPAEYGGDTLPDDLGDWFDPWRSSATMPRWASRYSLRVVSVRVQRVREVTEEEAAQLIRESEPAHGEWCDPARGRLGHWSYRKPYAAAWDAKHAKRPGESWADNPFTWVVTVTREEPTT